MKTNERFQEIIEMKEALTENISSLGRAVLQDKERKEKGD